MWKKQRITFEEKLSLAERTMDLDDKGFMNLCEEVGIDPQQLAYYSNAYEAAGESGVKALDYKKKMPDGIRKEAMEKLTKYFDKKLPQHVRDKLGIQIKADGNKIAIAERRPFYRDNSKWTTNECAMMKYTDHDNRWHLYWKRASGKWFPFVPTKEVFTVEDCIRELDGGNASCFWG